jgi:hypothetical protein
MDVLPHVEAVRRAGAATLRGLAAALAARGVPAPADGRAWRPEQVRRVLAAAPAADGARPASRGRRPGSRRR